ncbi:uncharacterized protein TNCV_1552591 [Trichonephila clavipes]|nr:uncharacterized protein TNCV_1552591 [Trichonephila clavipes]
MRNKDDILIKDLLLEEIAKELLEQREFLRNDAKKNIETIQSENRKTYNRKRKKASLYKEGDLIAIQRTQFGAGLKLRPKFLGLYKVTKVNSKDRYEVEKRPTNHCLFNTSRLYRISAPSAAPPVLTSKNEKGLFPRLLKFGLAIHQNDHQARRRFVEWAQNEIAVVPDFHTRILFSDEAHFWLNGYVKKQNCRIWSEANPQVYVETPLHPEKLTVWCALWAGGILLQKR